MPDRIIEITQTGDHFTMEFVDGPRRNVAYSDEGPAKIGHEWWLNPSLFNLPEELKTLGCSDAQIRQAIKGLTSGKDTHIKFKVPR